MGLYAIRSRIYGKPGYEIDDFYDYSNMTVSQQQDHLLLSYSITTEKNSELNNEKFSILNYCIGYTFVSLLLALVVPLFQQFGIIDWVGNLPTQYSLFFGLTAIVYISLLPPLAIYGTLEYQRNDI
jgi:hypothetical protein